MPNRMPDGNEDPRIVCKTMRAELGGKVLGVAVQLKTGRWGVARTDRYCRLTLDAAHQVRGWLKRHWPSCTVIAETEEID